MARLNFLNFSCVLLVLIGASSANFCNDDDDTGYWVASIAQGVTDYAYGGSRLNTNYYCFEGCLNTGTVLQNYKVDLAGNATKTERSRAVGEISRDDYDPNLESCIDPVLREDVKNALQKTTQNTCKNIVNTLVLNLNRPGWAITCIQFSTYGIDDTVADKNFCSYDTSRGSDNLIYTVRIAKLDMSSNSTDF